MGVSMSTVESLYEAGHDSIHLRDEGLVKTEDTDILAKARGENRIVLTFDLIWISVIYWPPPVKNLQV